MYHSIKIGKNQDWRDTWDDWHLIPSKRPDIAIPQVKPNLVAIPGRDIPIDLSDYLTGGPVFGTRSGTIDFIAYVEANELLALKNNIISFVNGKSLQMILEDDPNYYYEGRFIVSSVSSTESYPSVKINYSLDPFKYKVWVNGEHDVIWDTFNFETDYDYNWHALLNGITPNGSHMDIVIPTFEGFGPITMCVTLTSISDNGIFYCKFANGPVFSLTKDNLGQTIILGTCYNDVPAIIEADGIGTANFTFRETSL